MPNPFQAPLAAIRASFEAALPVITAKAGAIIVSHSIASFNDQGWTDNTLEPWTPRKSQEKKDVGRAILIQSGRLRRSIRVISATDGSVTIGTDVPYAKIQNEGGAINFPARGGILNFDRTPAHGLWRFGKANTINQQRGIKAIRRVTYKAHTSTITKRKFLGNSVQQTEKIRTMIRKVIGKAFTIIK